MKGRLLCAAIVTVLTLAPGHAEANFRIPSADATVAAGAACTGSDFLWPSTTGTALQCVSNVWTAVGGASQWTTSGSDIYYTTGAVAIGTTSPDAALTVAAPDVSTSQLRLRSARAGIVSTNVIGGIEFMSNDGSLTAPGIVTAGIQALATATHTTSNLGTDIVFNTTTGTTYSEAMRINGSGNVAIGTTTMAGKLNVQQNSTATNSDVYGLHVSGAQSAANSATNFGMYVNPTYSGTGTTNALIAGQVVAQNASTGTVSYMYGLSVQGMKSGTGAVTSMVGLSTKCVNSNATGTVTNCYALYIDTPTTTGAITNKWGLYQSDPNSNNYFAGNLGIGTSNPATMLDVRGSTPIITVANSSNQAGSIYLGNSSHGLARGTASANNVTLYTTSGSLFLGAAGVSSNHVTVLTGGNVGIGSTNPGEKLTVVGSIDASVQFLGQASDTASAPSFSWTGDTNAGIYRPATDTIGFVTSGTEAMRISSGNEVSINTTAVTNSAKLNVVSSSSATNATTYGVYISGAQTAALASNGYEGLVVGTGFSAASGNTISWLRGINSTAVNSSSGSVNGLYALAGYPANSSTGTVASMFAVFGNPAKNGTGPITQMYGFYSRCDNNNATGAVTNCYGLFIDTPTTTGAITNKWGVYQKDPNTNNYFAGSVNIGTNVASVSYLNFGGTVGTSGYGIRDNGGTIEAKNSGGSWASLGGGGIGAALNTQTFNSSGTWTKPGSGSIAKLECWGGGEGGQGSYYSYDSGSGNYTDKSGGGGAGGDYLQMLLPLSELGATETVTIGAGGSGGAACGTSGGGSGCMGNAGGDTTIGSILLVAGGNSTYTSAYGGGGGGQKQGTNQNVAGGSGRDTFCAGAGGGSGGASGAGGTAAGGAGGTSICGGNGGAGGQGTNSPAVGANGTAPGGGGGGGGVRYNTTRAGGNGAAGKCIVTVY